MVLMIDDDRVSILSQAQLGWYVTIDLYSSEVTSAVAYVRSTYLTILDVYSTFCAWQNDYSRIQLLMRG
jgi:hypothetical protein